jgi:hypothetical protein
MYLLLHLPMILKTLAYHCTYEQSIIDKHNESESTNASSGRSSTLPALFGRSMQQSM